MPLTIPVAHDFVCPWCWVGLVQAIRLKREFGVAFDWLGYELYPEELGWPDTKPRDRDENRPHTPGRFELLLWAENMSLPKVERPNRIRTRNPHLAVEYAKIEGVSEPLVEAIYRAFWEEGRRIDEIDVLRDIATGIVDNVDAMADAISERRQLDRIIMFDEPAHEAGVYNVPTFFVGDERIAEHPYAAIRKKVQKWVEVNTIYEKIEFGETPEDRPYVCLNMVATIDGKTVSGSRDESVADLGSKVDHLLMKRIDAAVDAVVIGAQTLRATSPRWNPQSRVRLVISGSGEVPYESAFLSEGEAYVVTSAPAKFEGRNGVKVLEFGTGRVDLCALLHNLRTMGIRRLLVLGGSELNAQLLRNELVDELFLTIAPKVKLGRNLPTYAGGDPLSRDEIQRYRLVEFHQVGDEVFLRYRR